MTALENSLPSRLTLSDLDQASDVMARAFSADPLWCYLAPAEQKRSALLAQFFRPLIKLAILNGQAYGALQPVAGVAVWSVPGQSGTGLRAVLQSGLPMLAFSGLVFALARVGRIFARFEAMQKRYAPEPHYYLNTIGVDPSAQGQGLASRLIKPFLAEADARGLSVYTETMTPANVGLYKYYGFEVQEQYAVPGTDLSQWAFYRPARR